MRLEQFVPLASAAPPPLQSEVLILGGGVAGCAAAIALAREGRAVTLIERELTTRHKVCGEFLSGEALADLDSLGIDVASLGAVPIAYVRLAAARRAAQAPLPFPAASLTRKALDTALLAGAIAAGVRVERGRGVQALNRTTDNGWQATLDDGTTHEAPTAFLATGKHDLRGHSRPEDPQRWVAFKMYFRLAPAQAAELACASELMLYPGGYGGIQPVEGGVANLCCVLQQQHFARVGHRWENFLTKMQEDCPHLAMRLAGAKPLLAKPIAITHIPYGFIRRTTDPGLYCLGDQAAVIPSFTGDGISIALYTARCAAAAYLAAEPAPLFQVKLRSALLAQMRLAEFAADGLNHSVSRAVLPFCLRVWPGVMRLTARLTRVTQPGADAPHTSAGLEVPPHRELDMAEAMTGGPVTVVPIRRDAMRFLAVFVLAVTLAPHALAQHETFVLDPKASQVKMTLKTTHELVNGTFHLQSGSIGFDQSTHTMSGSVTVLAGSGDTGNGSRDKKMHKEILHSEQHGNVSFDPKSYLGTIAPAGDSTIQVAGIFTLLGKPHEITIPMVVHLEGTTATVKADFVVPYVQWGLKNPSFFIWKADNDVAIDLVLTGRISRQGDAFPVP